jgi:hypothetical protein
MQMRPVSRISLSIFFICFAFFFSSSARASDEAAFRHNSRGVKRLQVGDHIGAIEDLRIAHRYMPSNPDIKKNLGIAYNNYAFFLKSKGLLLDAITQYSKALQYDSDNAFTHYNLGQAFYQVQNMSKAEEHLAKAYEIDASLKGLKQLLARVRGEGATETGFDRLETMHFILAVDSSVPVEKMSYVRTHLEEAYGRVGMVLGHYPGKKTIVIVYGEEAYSNMLKGMPHWALAVYDGKVRIPANRLKYSEEDVRKIIYHEYAHAVVRDITGGNCPTWLNEGISGLAESLVYPRDKNLIRRYVQRYGIVPLRSMPDDFTALKKRELMTLLYMQSYTIVEFIIKRSGSEGLKNILSVLGRGENVWRAISGVMQQSMADFEKEWQRYMASEYGWKGVVSYS